MKTVIAMILVFALFDATAAEVVVSKMSRTPGYTDRYDLKTSLDEKVVLDCQSFIQGLLFGENGESGVMLQEWECDELIVDMKKSLSRRKTHCLEVDVERSVLEAQHTCP